MSEEINVIYVGRKPPMSYVLGIITSFGGSNAREVTLKARGRAISTAVDAVEIARKRFMKELTVSKIALGTEEMPPREGLGSRNVSTIEITLTKETKPEKKEISQEKAKKPSEDKEKEKKE